MARASEATGLSILLLLLLGTIAIGQQYQPAIEYQSLMNLRYYENNGGFLIEDLQLVFPPTNTGNVRVGRSGTFIMSIVVDGQTITSMPFRCASKPTATRSTRARNLCAKVRSRISLTSQSCPMI